MTEIQALINECTQGIQACAGTNQGVPRRQSSTDVTQSGNLVSEERCEDKIKPKTLNLTSDPSGCPISSSLAPAPHVRQVSIEAQGAERRIHLKRVCQEEDAFVMLLRGAMSPKRQWDLDEAAAAKRARPVLRQRSSVWPRRRRVGCTISNSPAPCSHLENTFNALQVDGPPALKMCVGDVEHAVQRGAVEGQDAVGTGVRLVRVELEIGRRSSQSAAALAPSAVEGGQTGARPAR